MNRRSFVGMLTAAFWPGRKPTPANTAGALGSSQPTVTTAPANGDKQIVTGNWTSSTAILKRGDIVSFAGCNAVNPISYRDVGILRMFVVTDDVSSDGAGAATIPVSPAFDSTGSPFQNVVALPAAGANIRVFNQLQADFAAAREAEAQVPRSNRNIQATLSERYGKDTSRPQGVDKENDPTS